MRKRSGFPRAARYGLLLILIVLKTARADIQYVTTYNEFGDYEYQTDKHGKITKVTQSPGYYSDHGGPPQYLVYDLVRDPTDPKDTRKVPRFSTIPGSNFTERITPGDVYLAEPGITDTPSDYLRFIHINGLPGPAGPWANAVFFYSDADCSPGSGVT